jgi:hypothetical protein
VEAAVVLRGPGIEAELLAFCRERLAEFKCPKKIHIVPEIPRTATAKVQRRMVSAAFKCHDESAVPGELNMKFAIAGAGAIGAYLGAQMTRAGLDVTLFAHLASGFTGMKEISTRTPRYPASWNRLALPTWSFSE